MSDSFHFEAADLFTVGTLGPKGQRAFYLQCRSGPDLVSLKLEKQQVAALAEYLDRVLDQLPEGTVGDPPTDLDLREPVVEAWTVGAMGVAYDESDDRVIVFAEEMSEDEDEDAIVASARFSLTREQVVGLVGRARDVVAAGRPPCPYCARPLDPANGDWCPCHN